MIRAVSERRSLSEALAAERLGVGALVFFVMAAAAPLTNVAGTFTVAYGVTGNIGLPAAFLVIGVVLGVFVPGYVTMGRHLPHAGAFYAYASAGLGRTVGVAAAWIAVVSYNMLQIGFYGAAGAAASPLVKIWFGLDLPWWVFGLISWALVGILGVFRVDINGQVLAALTTVEVILIVIYDVSFARHPAHGLPLYTFSPTELLKPGVGAILAIAVLCCIGFESTVVFSEESRDRQRTVPRATYVGIGAIAVLYAVSAWAMAVTVGVDKIADAASKSGPTLLFDLVTAQLGSAAATIGNALFVTSLVAAMISMHNTTARYVFALGREGVLPQVFGRTSASGAPKAGSVAQTVLALIVIVIFAVGGLDPLVQLFYMGGASGALGIIVLLMLASVAVVSFFAKNRRGETVWHALIAPILAFVGVGGVLYLVLLNFGGLLGVADSSPLRWGIPGTFAVVGFGGLLYGLYLKRNRPDVYSVIGLGAESVTIEPHFPIVPTEATTRRARRDAV
jgi:amino acid transporter